MISAAYRSVAAISVGAVTAGPFDMVVLRWLGRISASLIIIWVVAG
jgi:hypothetical protein